MLWEKSKIHVVIYSNFQDGLQLNKPDLVRNDDNYQEWKLQPLVDALERWKILKKAAITKISKPNIVKVCVSIVKQKQAKDPQIVNL